MCAFETNEKLTSRLAGGGEVVRVHVDALGILLNDSLDGGGRVSQADQVAADGAQ